MPKKRDHFYWVAFPQRISKVLLIRKGVSGRKLRQPTRDPHLVENEEGDQFVVSGEQLFDTPMAATEASIEYAKKLGVEPMREQNEEQEREDNPVEVEEEEEDPDEEDSDEDEDSDDEEGSDGDSDLDEEEDDDSDDDGYDDDDDDE